MRPDQKDAAYLWDILDAARTITGFIKDIPFTEYERDRKIQMAVERGLEIIGEAARLVSDGFKERHPDIPWRSIIAQRNVIAHEYGEIRQERIWELLKNHIPGLIEKIRPLVPKPPVK